MMTTEEAVVTRATPAHLVTLRKLYSAAGVEHGAPLVLRQGQTAIGRAVSAGAEGIMLPRDRRASRLHATLSLRGLELHARDEGSRNGTFVNGERVAERRLGDGDLLQIGETFFLVRHEKSGPGADPPIEGILGVSPAARQQRAGVALFAPTPATVLLQGESGTGKEVVAAALHRASGRQGPFVAVNCSAIPESLAESQLFGHAAGAFTGAVAQLGFFRAARGGTLFLDEVGDLSPAVQPKLLRALEERAVIPVGLVAPVPCDVRLIAATNRDLSALVREGAFRTDLYTRLAEVTLRLPPLRERREDILPLLEHAFSPLPPLSAELCQALLLHPWPGNVRELFKAASELRIRGADARALDLDLLTDRFAAPEPPTGPADPATRPPRAHAKAEVPARADAGAPAPDQLVTLLRQYGGNIADIARATGRSRKQVYRWLAQHGLDIALFRDAPEPPKAPDLSGDPRP